MSQHISIVAQAAMDSYYGQYKSDSDFFELSDFIERVAAVVADAYQQEFRLQYQEIRSEKKDEIVGFDPSWLSEQELTVKEEDGVFYSDLQVPILSFAFDKNTSGVQNLFFVKPNPGKEIQRSSVNETWQYKFMPYTNEVFYRIEGKKIKYYKNGACPYPSLVSMLYVPAVGDNMYIPDGLINTAINNTVLIMKQVAAGVVVKKSLDGNQNEILQTEMDKLALKP